ncbi:MAG TPA: DUF1996 domain-containing protein [Streptosporangiaceae bacterium]
MRRRRSKVSYYPARRGSRSRPERPQTSAAPSSLIARKPGLLAVIVALAVAGGVIVGIKVGAGSTPVHLSAGDAPSASASASADPSDSASADPSASAAPSDSAAPQPSDSAAAPPTGPSPDDFVNIRQVTTRVQTPRPGQNASRGSFVSRCGTNANGHNNPDNFIVTPGVPNGAHHQHDYVGNVSTDNTSTDQSLAAAGTTCGRGDKSAYFWPVLRSLANAAGQSGQDGNVGTILRPTAATIQFRGNAQGKVVAMPQFLRIVTGNAHAFTQNGTNAKASWSCTGFTNRTSGDKYPLCPRGSQVVRTLDFPSCWDGQNTDSANHRTHVVFPDAASGACPAGTKAIPQLRFRLTYRVPSGPSFAVDSFPEEIHKPITDHGDFENVMPTRLMNMVVSCINRNRNC